MLTRPTASPALRLVVALVLVLAGSILAACTNDDQGGDGGSRAPSAHAEAVAQLLEVLPSDARGVFAADLATLLDDAAVDTKAAVEGLLAGSGDPALAEPFGHIGRLTGVLDDPSTVTTALLVQPVDAADGPYLLAAVADGTTNDDLDAAAAEEAGLEAALLHGGVLVAGSAAAVERAKGEADGEGSGGRAPIEPFLVALDPTRPISYIQGMPALFDGDQPVGLTLASASAVSAALEVEGGVTSGTMAFHTPNAAAFVEAYNGLDRNAWQGEDPLEEPLTVADPMAADLPQVVVPLPAAPIDPSPKELLASRNLFKKLFVGMEAHEYAEGVAALERDPWVDLIVKSEADGDEPPSPGSVFIRWRFKDQAAIEAFERDELPAGFTLAPTRFLESDPDEGEVFLALNLYNSGGGSIVSGARAEWDVFVDPPEGADPDAGTRPRFFIVDALAEAVSADPVNLVTPAEPLSHAFDGDQVVSTVRKLEGAEDVPVFAVTFPKPEPDSANVARFTREMAIGNDYIYWGYGVHDRVLYNATTFNHDSYFVDPSTVDIVDDTKWAKYLEPEALDVVYYVNTLEYVASPLANLDSEHLDITLEWLEELIGFKNNGHQAGLVRAAVDQLFRGASDALVGSVVRNEAPTTHVHLDIDDPEGLEAALGLPEGQRLAPISVVAGEPARHMLSLTITQVDDALEGARAEWSAYVDAGDGRPPRQVVLDLQTSEVAFDPDRVLALPADVVHAQANGTVTARASSPGLTFDASIATAGMVDELPSLDWIESADSICSSAGICDERYYDAETLDVPLRRAVDIDIEDLTTPWDEFLAETEPMVHLRTNAQELAVKRWQNLKVEVPELPFTGLDERTHELTGTGTLTGRSTDVVDSTYTYTGDVLVDGDQLTFAMDQQIENALGLANIYTTGSFDLTTGRGSQTVVGCQGPDLMCSDIERGSTSLYAAQRLDATDPDLISWHVEVAIDLGGTFGIADSSATFTATRAG